MCHLKFMNEFDLSDGNIVSHFCEGCNQNSKMAFEHGSDSRTTGNHFSSVIEGINGVIGLTNFLIILDRGVVRERVQEIRLLAGKLAPLRWIRYRGWISQLYTAYVQQAIRWLDVKEFLEAFALGLKTLTAPKYLDFAISLLCNEVEKSRRPFDIKWYGLAKL